MDTYISQIIVLIAFLIGYYLGVYYPTAKETLNHIKGLPKKSLELVKKPRIDIISPTKKFREELFNKEINKEDES